MGFEGGNSFQSSGKQKKFLQRLFQASNSVQAKEKGARLPYVSLKNRSNGWGSEDRREPGPRFASNNIHTKSGADNFQGKGLGRSLGASQVSI